MSQKNADYERLRLENERLKEEKPVEQEVEKKITDMQVELNKINEDAVKAASMQLLLENILLHMLDGEKYKTKLKSVIKDELKDFFDQHRKQPDREKKPLFMQKFGDWLPVIEELGEEETKIIETKINEFSDFADATFDEVFKAGREQK